jgi:hypothetical protein
MATAQQGPQDHHRSWVAADAVRHAFWVLTLGVIVLYAFLVALGAFAPGDVVAVSVVVAVLAVLWIVHAWLQRGSGERDPGLRAARERRGF